MGLEEIYCAGAVCTGGKHIMIPLAWKEVREHEGIWLTMVLLTVAVWGLAWPASFPWRISAWP